MPGTPRPTVVGRTCLALACLFLLAAFTLQCVPAALIVALGAAAAGSIAGVSLAMVTRTTRVGVIYAWLATASAAGFIVIAGWPRATPAAVHPWHGAPAIVWSYFDVLRAVIFVLAVIYPFVVLGRHAPD